MAKAKQDKLRFNAWTMGGRGAELFEKSAEDLELERMNPLRGVDEWRLGQIFDDARSGVYADLAWLYDEIEQVEPALCVCCDMRESAASEFGWIVRTAPEDRTRGFDASLADEQRRALLVEFGAVEDDLADLAGHLDSAFFRGAAHAQPLWNADGSLAGFRALDLWNFALDRLTGVWYWNADASRDESTFQPVPPGEVVSLASSRHVDHSALPIFIRSALGAKRYGVWLDRFGIPPVGVIMPATAERADQAAYMDLARKFARGGSGILPNGSNIVYGTEARAVCPFPEFIRFQQQQIYTVALGRVQSGESAGDNLGGNAAGVVEGGFRRIVRRDARRIARAINDTVTRKILARLFPGRPALAQFAWDTEAKRTGREVLEDAALAKNAGLEIDVGQIAEMTGYRVASAPETPSPGAFGGLNSRTGGATPLQRPLQGLAKREEGSERTTEPAGGATPQRAILAAFAEDTSKAAEEVRRLLDDPTPERAGKLLADLPSLIPDDPALAAVIADAMANEFSAAFASGGRGASSQAVNGKRGVCTSPRGQSGCKSDTCPGKHGNRGRRNSKHVAPSFVADPDEDRIATMTSISHGMSTKALSDVTFNGTAGIGYVPSSVAVLVAQSTKGPNQVDVEGFRQLIPAQRIRKADKAHGQPRKDADGNDIGERRPEQKPLTQADYDRIALVKTRPDSVKLGSPRQGLPMLQYSKTFDDGTLTTVWEVSKSAMEERFYDMWKK